MHLAGHWSPQAFLSTYVFASAYLRQAPRENAELLEPYPYLRCNYTSTSKASMRIPGIIL